METTTITIYKASQGHWLYKDEVMEDGIENRTFASQVMNADDSLHGRRENGMGGGSQAY